MTKKLWAFGACVLLSAALTTGCTDDDSPDDAPTTTATTPASPAPASVDPSVAASQRADAEDDAGIAPVPEAKDATAYIARLREIDNSIVSQNSSEKLIDAGRDQCTTIYDTADRKKLIEAVNVRFANAGNPDGYSEATATMINAAVKKYICPTDWN
ncbi:MAG: DUF732 domain-containing protein [Mycobacterium sp.]